MVWKWMIGVIGIALATLPVVAQEMETVTDIVYDSVVDDTIVPSAFYDWWILEAVEGDLMVVDMAATGGLEPLIGILDPGGELVGRSPDGAPDSTVTLEYTVPATGQYIIVATRVGNANGTSTGSYSLRVRRANDVVDDIRPTQDVTFRCENFEVTTAATMSFLEDERTGLIHRMTVYGVDGFQPVIRMSVEDPTPYEVCNTNADLAIGDMFTIPGEDTRTITDADLDTVSQFLVSGAEEAGVITVTIGSKDGAPGRYMAIIEGFTIDPADDTDIVEVGIGPLAARTTSLWLYMVAAQNSRLDPIMRLLDTDDECDDAGRVGCEALPTFTGAGAVLHEGGVITTLKGDRSDAGLLLNPGGPDFMSVELGSRSRRTRGGYVLVLVGELPARE